VACDPQSIARKWLLIGAFAQSKSVFVFTEEPNVYYNIFEDLPPKVMVIEAIRGKDFQFEDALSQWSGF
jgi:hypothetical protein